MYMGTTLTVLSDFNVVEPFLIYLVVLTAKTLQTFPD